jgi:hypothetical protein
LQPAREVGRELLFQVGKAAFRNETKRLRQAWRDFHFGTSGGRPRRRFKKKAKRSVPPETSSASFGGRRARAGQPNAHANGKRGGALRERLDAKPLVRLRDDQRLFS